MTTWLKIYVTSHAIHCIGLLKATVAQKVAQRQVELSFQSISGCKQTIASLAQW
jgi:hypothetical protein